MMSNPAKWTLAVAVGLAAVNVYALAHAGQWLGIAMSVAFLGAGAMHLARLRSRNPGAVVPVVQWIAAAQVVFGFWALFADDLESCERALRQRGETPQRQPLSEVSYDDRFRHQNQ